MALERLVGHFGAVVNARYRGKVELTFSRKGGHGVMRISGMPAADRSISATDRARLNTAPVAWRHKGYML
jgi:hypothetical protein